MNRTVRWVASTLVAAMPGFVQPTLANHIIMTVDPSQSSVVLSGQDTLYGQAFPQAPGSDTTTVDGHFLVDFDASSTTPGSIQFFAGHGSSAYKPTGGGASFQPLNLPANFAMRNAAGTSTGASRDLSWDWSSGSVPVNAAGEFASSGVHFATLSGSEDVENANLGSRTFSAAGIGDYLDSGTSSLTQVAPGSWRLVMNLHYAYTSTVFGPGITTEGQTLNYDGTIVATAQFGADNVAVIDPFFFTDIDVLGGATQTGGVSATFNEFAGAGEFSATDSRCRTCQRCAGRRQCKSSVRAFGSKLLRGAANLGRAI